MEEDCFPGGTQSCVHKIQLGHSHKKKNLFPQRNRYSAAFQQGIMSNCTRKHKTILRCSYILQKQEHTIYKKTINMAMCNKWYTLHFIIQETVIFSGGIQLNITMAHFQEGGTPLLKVNEKSPLLTRTYQIFLNGMYTVAEGASLSPLNKT